MRRRRLLAALATTGLAGCTGRSLGSDGSTRSDTGSGRSAGSPTPTAGTSLVRQGFPPTLCSETPVELGIVPIDEPAFAADWSGIDPGEDYGSLDEGDAVVGIDRDGHARAYPVSVLWHHEIVNERFPDGTPLLVTYCSLCRSGMVARRVVDGEPTRFGVSGLLWRPPKLWQRASEASNRTFAVEVNDASADLQTRQAGNLVMYDELTGSYWSQILARGLCGPHARDPLPIAPSTVATWGDWRTAHPDTEVLLPPPHSTVENPPYPRDGPPAGTGTPSG